MASQWFYRNNILSNAELTVNTRVHTIQRSGFLAYEYNPFRNYRITKDSAEAEAGSLVDLDTEELGFDLEHPVDIEIQPSYDGSVNLLLNDGKNQPRLINSRFSTRELKTYEVVDRIGNNDTNIYDQGIQFNQDTSLLKKVNLIPKIRFNGVIPSGKLPVGNYTLYFRYEDADGNESDFVGETSTIAIFKGNDSDPFSIDGGIANMNSNKSLQVTLTNIDESYDYVSVYVVRSSAQQDGGRYTEVYKVRKHYIVRNGVCNIIITGDEAKIEQTIDDINAQFFLASSSKAQAQCQNRLFLGNVAKPLLPHKDFIDISLAFQPYVLKEDRKSTIGNVNPESYIDDSNANEAYEYYNTHNIYYKVGYWDEEIYRLGIVYILKDGSLSPVYNILGNKQVDVVSNPSQVTYVNLPENISIDEEMFTIHGLPDIYNSKGVIKIDDKKPGDFIYSIGVSVDRNIADKIKAAGAIGFFLVRQKRFPTILAQAYTLPKDAKADVPVISDGNKFYVESFISDKEIITHNYKERLVEVDKNSLNNKNLTALCPEFMYDQPFYNSLFTGSSYPYKLSKINYDSKLSRSPYDQRFYIAKDNVFEPTASLSRAKFASITDENPLVNIGSVGFRGFVGNSKEVNRFRYIGVDNRYKEHPTNICRGVFSPYLGIVSNNQIPYNKLINIYIPEYSPAKINGYFRIRFEDGSPYFPISERIVLEDFTKEWNSSTLNNTKVYQLNFYRGDCYICTFTHRLNRNFLDNTTPTNDVIVDPNTWKDNYHNKKLDNINKINLGDINAVQLGSWITFKVRSSTNLSIRSLDESHINEYSVVGNPRGFYPLQQSTVGASYKIPQSYLVNDGYRRTTGVKEYVSQPDVPYLKNNFTNRILYSDIAVNDAFKNGYRVFRFANFRDYSREYGSIIELVELHGQLLVVFEHGVLLLPINERIAAGSPNEIFINSNNVLPSGGRILSDTFGSQWKESIIKTPYYVYGVDTVAKKIWRTDGSGLQVISDLKVNKFLVDNITLTERETTPIIGIRNVKSHYNANKADVMFTFYDNTYGYEETAWNLCWNELHQQFITFYSWLPSYSENIDNQYFSFDRETSRAITKLSGVEGLLLSNDKDVAGILNDDYSIKIEAIKKRTIPEGYTATYSLPTELYSLNSLYNINGNILTLKGNTEEEKEYYKTKLLERFKDNKVNYFKIKATLTRQVDGQIKEYKTKWEDSITVGGGYYEFTTAVTLREILENPLLTEEDKSKPSLTTDFWKHGSGGIYDIKERIKPTFWYGRQHPFEFEFVVKHDGQVQKIFNNLVIISNKAEPESFHFEVVGEGYDFMEDKMNMYYRQEAAKNTYQNLGSDIVYDRKYLELADSLIQNGKSTILPWYYERIDTYNNIYHSYQLLKKGTHLDYQNLSGSEIVWDRDLNEFNIVTHIKNSPIDKVGRLRGNSQYLEDRWQIQIPSITFMQKNEKSWKKPPLVLSFIPNDARTTNLQVTHLPKGYESISDSIDLTSWSSRHETKLRDKYCKVRVRYSGKDLAIIAAIHTIFTKSYA